MQAKFLADVSEFLALDKKFRETLLDAGSVQNLLDDIREVILAKGFLQKGEEDFAKALKQKKAAVIAKKGVWPSEVRKRILGFLDTLLADPSYGGQEREKNVQADPSLTPHQALMKSQAKELYVAGKYEEAITLGLRLLHDSPRVQRNPGVLGFLMNCYNKLKNYSKVWEYAEKLLALKNHEPSRADLGMAVSAAYKLGQWEAVSRYGELLLALDSFDRNLIRMIQKANAQTTRRAA